MFSLPRELYDWVLDLLDFPSLLAWRGTCRRNQQEVNTILVNTRNRILAYFIDDVDDFLRMLTWDRAVISGDAALAFFLRDDMVLGIELEVAVPFEEGYDFEDHLIARFHCTPTHGGSSQKIPQHHPETRRYSLPSGSFLVVAFSHTSSPIPPVVGRDMTAHINFFSENAFGCGYPALTLRRNSYAHDPSVGLSWICKFDRELLQNKCGFRVSSDVCTLVPAGIASLTPQGHLRRHSYPGECPCIRSHYLCPGQERFFGDRGSLVGFFDGSTDAIQRMFAEQQAPFGPAAVWRLECYKPCVSSCDSQNVHLMRNEQHGHLSAMHEPFRYGPRFRGWEWL